MSFLNLEQWPFSGLTTTAAVLVTVYFILYQFQLTKTRNDEPPIIASAIPFVGHLLGMALFGGRYVKNIGLRNLDKPIFTLPVPGSRIYVVTDPSLAAAVQRASKALSFTPLIPDVTKRVLGLDTTTVEILRQNLDPEPGEPRGFLADVHDMVYGYLGPGEPLNELSLGAAREMARQVNACAESMPLREKQQAAALPSPGGEAVDLLLWVRHLVTVATAQFLYGPLNPIAQQPELEDAFWDFDHGLGALMINVVPSVTAAKPYRGRETLARAMGAYLQTGGYRDRGASDIVRQRVALAERYSFTVEATARSELSFLFAGIVNTAVTTFWVVLNIFARPDVLRAVRAELEQAIVPPGADSAEYRTLDLEVARNGCPTLLSVFRECLRVGSDNYSTRLVRTDTLLAGRYHLAAGSVVQVAGGVIHADRAIWGADADAFNPYRFLKLQDAKQQQQQPQQGQQSPSQGPAAVHPAAFRAFGGGKTMCPGRHFATGEILALAAMVVLTFDIAPADGGEKLRVPRKNDGVLPVHILEPRPRDVVKVVVSLRDGEMVRPLRVV